MDTNNWYICGPLKIAPLELEADPLGTIKQANDKFGRVLTARLMGMWEQRMLDSLPHIHGNFLWDKFAKDRLACEKLLMPLEVRS